MDRRLERQNARTLFRGSIGYRLLAVNLILWLGLAGIGLVVFLSFGRVRELVDTSLSVNLHQVLDNARTSRILSQVLADSNLLVGTFYGRQYYLIQTGGRLLAQLAEADARTPSPALRAVLAHVSTALSDLLAACRAVNERLAALDNADAAVHKDIERLEGLVSDRLIDRVQAGETISHLEQLAAMIAGYRESLLIIRGEIQSLRPSVLPVAQAETESREIAALTDLGLRVRVLSASQEDVAAIGRSLAGNLADYTRLARLYRQDMVKLKADLADFDAVHAEVLGRLADADAAISRTESVMRREIDSSVTQTKTAVALLGLVVLGVLAALTTAFLVTTIHRPVREILRVLTAYRGGDLSARMHLDRKDEWALVQGSLNAMAAELEALMRARDAAEAALRASEEKYRSIFENAQEGIFRATPEGRFESANPAMARLLGFDSPEDLVSRVGSISEDLHLDPGARSRLLAAVREKGIVRDHQIRFRRADGQVVILSLTANLIRTAAGETRVECVAADVTERVRQAAELTAAKETAEQATAAKSVFLAKMSHELRTPLSGILGLTELALESAPSPGLAKYIDGIRQSAQDLLTLINDLLDFSKIEAGRFELELMDFDLAATVEAAVAGLTYQARRKGLAIDADIDRGTPAYLVGDPYRLRRILVNLLGNAVKFTEQGRIHLHVGPAGPDQAPPAAPDEAVLAFTVTDTGIGIPADQQAVIFDSFTQAQGNQSRKYGGTGLGLAICRELAELMGGRIWVSSEPGKGSTFTFTARFGLSAQRADAEAEATRDEGPVLALSVLLAEDNAVNRLYATDLLARWGFTVQAVANGREAVHALAGQHFDLVLMDVEMPEMDGITATRRIRAERERFDPSVPIIALTGHALHGDRERFLAAGMSGYVTKPLVREELLRVIREVMAGARPEPAVPAEVPAKPPTEAPTEADQPPLLDTSGALVRMGRDRALYAELLGIFLAALPGHLANLRQAAPGPDGALEAERLAQAAATIGARQLAEAAEALTADRADEKTVETLTALAEATAAAVSRQLAAPADPVD